MKKIILYVISALLVGFALLTLFLSTSVIFDLFDIRAKEGHYVLFVVWANFISSVLYFFSAYGLITSKTWAYKLLSVVSLILAVAFVGLIIHINTGGIYETKTIGGMIFRITLTIGFAIFAYFTTSNNKKSLQNS